MNTQKALIATKEDLLEVVIDVTHALETKKNFNLAIEALIKSFNKNLGIHITMIEV